MSERITVRWVLNDTVNEDTWTAERITFQHFPDGRMQVRLWRDGEVVEYIGYRRVERAHRVIGDGAPVPREGPRDA